MPYLLVLQLILLKNISFRYLHHYIHLYYCISRKLKNPSDRLFEITKHFLIKEMERGCKKAGLHRIRIHDLRHSHASLLIELGFAPLLISERLGLESVTTTLEIYSHLYPTKHGEVAERLQASA